jgi:hypothetical protein
MGGVGECRGFGMHSKGGSRGHRARASNHTDANRIKQSRRPVVPFLVPEPRGQMRPSIIAIAVVPGLGTCIPSLDGQWISPISLFV